MTHENTPVTTLRTMARVLLAACTVLVGCAGAIPDAADLGEMTFDPQTCAENAIRHDPDASLAREAAATFSERCAVHEVAACSMLGVAYELGVGIGRDHHRARGLYRHACDNGNVRACGNLGELMLADLEPGARPSAALELLQASCNGGNPRACAALGRAFAQGRVVPQDATTAATLFDRACARGEASACVEEADLIDRGAVQRDPRRSAQLVGIACARGDVDGCARATHPTLRSSRTLVAGVR
jgi:TPR repeat protein